MVKAFHPMNGAILCYINDTGKMGGKGGGRWEVWLLGCTLLIHFAVLVKGPIVCIQTALGLIVNIEIWWNVQTSNSRLVWCDFLERPVSFESFWSSWTGLFSIVEPQVLLAMCPFQYDYIVISARSSKFASVHTVLWWLNGQRFNFI